LKVFVDTGAFVALENRGDTFHAIAVRAYRRLLDLGASLHASDYVFDETVTLLGRRAGHEIAVGRGRRLLRSPLFELAIVDRPVLDGALDIFEGAGDEPFSFTDCASFALMRALEVETTLAFDDDFRRFGFEVVPRPREGVSDRAGPRSEARARRNGGWVRIDASWTRSMCS